MIECNAEFTLNGFDDQERNLTFIKMDFQVLKFKFNACNFKQAFYPLHKLHIAWLWQHKNTFIQAFYSVPGCQTCMCKQRHYARVKWLKFFLKSVKKYIDFNEIKSGKPLNLNRKGRAVHCASLASPGIKLHTPANKERIITTLPSDHRCSFGVVLVLFKTWATPRIIRGVQIYKPSNFSAAK